MSCCHYSCLTFCRYFAVRIVNRWEKIKNYLKRFSLLRKLKLIEEWLWSFSLISLLKFPRNGIFLAAQEAINYRKLIEFLFFFSCFLPYQSNALEANFFFVKLPSGYDNEMESIRYQNVESSVELCRKRFRFMSVLKAILNIFVQNIDFLVRADDWERNWPSSL